MRSGDRQAFDRFFRRHSARTLVYISYSLGPRLSRKLAPADILQNVYLKAFQSFERFCDRAASIGVRRLLIRMADHEITEAYRYHFKVEKRDARREVSAFFLGSGQRESFDPLSWLPSKARSASAMLVEREEYERVIAMLQELSPLEQYVTVLRVIEELPAAEIATRLDKTPGAVQMILSRVRDRLRKRAKGNVEEAP